jgi:hypothetical protein
MAMIGKMGTAVGLPSIELSLLFFELAPDWGEAMDQDPVAEGYPGGQHVGVLGTKDLLHQRQQRGVLVAHGSRNPLPGPGIERRCGRLSGVR